MLYLNGFLLAFAATLGLIYFLRPRAVYIGLVDEPSDRKQHTGNVPLIGGIAIFFGFLFSFLAMDLSFVDMQPYFAASLIIVIIGMLDDYQELSTLTRFMAQILAALIMCLWGGVILHDLGALSFDGDLLELGYIAIPFTVFAVVGVVNAVNMSDGIDGLSASLVLVALFGLVVVAFIAGDTQDLNTLVLLSCAVLAFLCFNLRVFRSRASVFMGDTGSMFLGFSLAWFIVSFTQGESRILSPVTALWFLMLPLFDTVGIMLRRILKGRSPFKPDREHFHHVLQLAGFSVNQTLVIMVAVATAGMLIGLVSFYWQVNELVMFILFLTLFSLYFFCMMRAWKVMRFLSRSICRRHSGNDRRKKQVALDSEVADRRLSDRRHAGQG